MKTILVVSHCILNKASKVKQDELDLQEEYALRKQFLASVIELDIQLLQLPCPEFILCGSRRWGHVKDQFDHPHFRRETKRMLEPVLDQLQEYLSYPDEYEIMGIVSVEGSPSCGYKLTCTGDWSGEIGSDAEKIKQLQSNLCMKNEPGMLMQILEKEMQQKEINVPIITMEDAVFMLSQKKENGGNIQ